MKEFHLKARMLASGYHLLFSAILVMISYFLVFHVWYPDAFAIASGVHNIVLILFAVDLTLGPLITFLIYKLNKKEFARDVFIILLVQISALVYGLYTLNQGRPVWATFVIDDIELISPAGIYDKHKQEFKDEYQYKWWQKPTFVASVYSSDEKIAQQQKEDEMFNGISLAARPETYQPIETRKEQILKKVKPIDELKKFNSNLTLDITKYPDVIGYLPVKGFDKDITALVNRNGEIITVVDLQPW